MEIDSVQTVEIDTGTIVVKLNNVISLLGYINSEPDEMFSQTVTNFLANINNQLEPRGVFLIKKISELDVKQGILTIDNKTLRVGKSIAHQLKESEYVALFIITIGSTVETLAKKLSKECDLMEGYTLNLIGSEAAEEVAEFVHEKIRKQAQKNGYSITNRFSPGYCNWDVSEQFNLFMFFNGNTAGVLLTDSALMLPIKSVSGIIGIGTNATFKPYNCNKCNDNKCIYRNKKQHT